MSSLDGTVVSSGATSFELDYGTGIVTVEMDDWDWYNEVAALLEGDKVMFSEKAIAHK